MTFLDKWIASWLDMLCGLIGVVTMTMYRPWWDFDYRCWATIRNMNKRMKIVDKS